jgi:hypothetical protein
MSFLFCHAATHTPTCTVVVTSITVPVRTLAFVTCGTGSVQSNSLRRYVVTAIQLQRSADHAAVIADKHSTSARTFKQMQWTLMATSNLITT